ncbi:MAG: prohibitin family protein, partial [Gammaproteobacteria bacterium]|nr:prohibitin family protein [Gammaproteobacteria bacterium]
MNLNFLKKNIIAAAVLAPVTILVLFLSIYTVNEGHVGIVKRFSKAIEQVDPGLHLKVPFVDSVEVIEVRQRKNSEDLAAATANQLPVTATVSINWTVDKSSAMDLFIRYGG